MPIYQYVCEKCGSRIEVLQKVNDPPLKRCTKCRGKLAKTVSRTSFQLKGSGWYATDYSQEDKSKGKEATTEKGDKVADKKSETVSPTTTASGESD
ncbi:MAG: FmdB family zinc ribbon protein [Blastocatellia bacterium]